MGTKLLFLGLTLMLAVPKLTQIRMMEAVGAVIMVLGAILLFLDK